MSGGIEAIAIKNLQTLLISKGLSAESLFSKYDIDGNGFLSYEEFSSALSSITGQTAPEAIVRAIIGVLDSDGDGSLSLPEIISLVDSDTSNQQYSAGSEIVIRDHPNPLYNGLYSPQDEINGKPSFRNGDGAILYYYNAGSGGAPSWSLDDREQDGRNDWYRGGWTRVPGSGGLPTGTRRWVGVGKITVFPSREPATPKSDSSDEAVTEEVTEIEIALAKSRFFPDEAISFTFTTPELPPSAWIGIVPSDIPHGDEALNDMHDTSFRYLEGRTGGGLDLPNPGTGEWTLRLHDDDENGREIAYVPFSVSGIENSPSPDPVEEVTLDDVTSQFSEVLALIDPQSTSVEAVEAGRSKADAEVSSLISKLPFTLQSTAGRLWDARADAYQAVVIARIPPAETLAAGLAAAGIAAAAASAISTESETPSSPPMAEEAPSPEESEFTSVSETPQSPTETPPEESEFTSVTETPQSPTETPPEVLDKESLSGVVQSFLEARLMSDQRRVVETHRGTPYALSIKISSLEKTFGIGIPDEYRGGSTIIAEVSSVDDPSFSCGSEIRLPASADLSDFRVGYESTIDASVEGWNSIRKRIIMGV